MWDWKEGTSFRLGELKYTSQKRGKNWPPGSGGELGGTRYREGKPLTATILAVADELAAAQAS